MSPVRLSAARCWFALCACAVTSLFWTAPNRASADDTQIKPDVLKAVKAATVHFRVTLSDGRIAEGSGFFTHEPGYIITNAHVVQMLDPESRKPNKIDVTIDSGTDKSRTLAGKVVGVDRGTDLALVKVEAKDLPTPLHFGPTKGLNETQSLFVFGFPFGQQLGKEITVNRSSVSSLRKSAAGTVTAVQLDGGLNPGNSGGPVVDTAGNVIGVAVSGVRGTTIGNAIPADHVLRFLNGRIVGSSAEVPYKEGDKLMMELTYELIDPLGRLKAIEVQIWAGNAGPARPASTTEPAPAPGDSEKQRFKAPYDKKSTVMLAVPLPKLADKQVYWMQPIITDGAGQRTWVAATTIPMKPPLERRAAVLEYRPKLDTRGTAEIVSNGDFRIRSADGAQDSLGINLKAAFSEAFQEDGPKGFPMQLNYLGFGFSILVNNRPLEKIADVRTMQGDIRFASADVDMEKDGSLANSKSNLARVPRGSKEFISDITQQILQSMEVLSIPLPGKKVEPLETWKSQQTFVIGSAILAVRVQANVTYKYMGVQNRNGKEGALIRIDGRVRGTKGGGLDVGGTLTGTAYVSLETGQVISADSTVKADMDLTFERKQAKAIASLAVSIKRPAPAQTPPPAARPAPRRGKGKE